MPLYNDRHSYRGLTIYYILVTAKHSALLIHCEGEEDPVDGEDVLCPHDVLPFSSIHISMKAFFRQGRRRV